MKELLTLIDNFWKAEKGSKEHTRLQTLLREQEPELRKHLYTSFRSDLGIERKEEADLVDYAGILARIHERQAAFIKDTAKGNPTFRVIKMFGLAAASVMLILGFNLLYNKTAEESESNRVTHISPKSKTTVIYNESSQPKAFRLADSSKVVLSANTTLRFDSGFNSIHRTLALEGEANFMVRKNRKIPFIVSSNGYTTTALGTQFTINNKESNNIKLKLISGKIVVRSTENSAFKIKDTYMRKGDEFVIDIRKKASQLNEARSNRVKQSEIPVKKINAVEKDQELYRFKNSKLSVLFDQLKRDSNKNIVYNEANLRGMTFTGEFKRTDSIQFILQVICHTNELSIREEGETILIGE